MAFNNYSNEERFKERCGYDINGVWYPRVTKIVNIKAKPALYFFYAGLENYAQGERIKKLSAEEGQKIHDAVEAVFRGEKPDVDPVVEPSYRAFCEWLEHNPVEADLDYIERRVSNHEHRYAGTVDSVVMFNGKLGVLDVKTSQDIYRDYNLQTAAYMAALKNELPDLQTRWILRIDQAYVCTKCGAKLREKGGRKKVKIDWGNTFMRACEHDWTAQSVGEVEVREFPLWQSDFEAFLGAKKLWEWENEDWLKKVGYLR